MKKFWKAFLDPIKWAITRGLIILAVYLFALSIAYIIERGV